MRKIIEMEMQVPPEVKILVEGKNIVVGKIKRYVPAKVEVSGNILKISGEKKYVNTTAAIVRSCIQGATKGFQKKLQIVYAHFPASFEIKEGYLLIKNFLGEKVPRKAKIIGSAQVKVEKDRIIVSGADAYDVGQTAANIKEATKIRHKDPRIFQDGVYYVREEE
jgi:large subunit ribosomal protein L6